MKSKSKNKKEFITLRAKVMQLNTLTKNGDFYPRDQWINCTFPSNVLLQHNENISIGVEGMTQIRLPAVVL